MTSKAVSTTPMPTTSATGTGAKAHKPARMSPANVMDHPPTRTAEHARLEAHAFAPPVPNLFGM
jgi:hypothetical protein